MRYLILLFLSFLCVPAMAEDGSNEKEEEKSLFTKIVDAFGKYLVGHLYRVMFYDIAFWDNTLTMGESTSKPVSLTLKKDGKEKTAKWDVFAYQDNRYELFEHVKLKSQEMATAQMLQQTGGQPLNPEQELQLESMTAQINAQEFQKLKQLSAQVSGQNQGPDPLIQLKQQELQMDQQKMQQDAQMDQAELQLDQQRMQNKATEFQQRLASQERQTQARIDAALQREMLKRGQ